MAETTSTEISLDGKICVHADPSDVYYPYVAGKANSFTLIAGPHCGRGWVLMLQRDAKPIVEGQTFHTLKFKNEKESLSIGGLVVVRAERVTTGGAASPTSLYLIEVADKRYLLERWSGLIAKAYNLRRFIPPYDGGFASTGRFFTDSLNEGALWTWQTLLTDIWDDMASGIAAGTAPTLPYTPHTNPDSFAFPGINRWDALRTVLAKLCCAITFDPVAGTFGYQKLGTTQSGLSAAETKYRAQLKHDWEPLQSPATRSPAKIETIFPRFQTFDDLEWENAFVHSDSEDTSVTGAVAGTAMLVYDDLRVTYDYDSEEQDNDDQAGRTTELVSNHKADLQTVRQRRIYQGICADFRCGSQAKVIQWRHLGLGQGMECEVIQGPGVPGSIVDNPTALLNSLNWHASENLAPPDAGRWTRPGMIVAVGKTDGSGVSARSGSTPGSGTVRIYASTTASPTVLADAGSGYDVTAKNLASAAVAENTWVVLLWDGVRWLVIYEDCGEE